MKKIFILFYVFVAFLCTLKANAEAFYIKNYDIKLKVNESKNINITEVLDVYFTRSKHGIVRTIPQKNEIIREDGTKERVSSKIKNIRVNQNFIKEYSHVSGMNDVVLRIGDEDRAVSGDVQYVINYDYTIPKPKTLKNKDELYFNLIGNDWNTNIDKVKFEIAMPKDFDKNLLGFSIGLKGMSGYNPNDLTYHVEGNTIKGETFIPLKNNEGLTLRLELPKDYFKYSIPPIFGFLSILTVILTFLSVFIWYFVGKDEKVIPIVNFYPPKNLNSAAVGSFFKEGANEKDIVSLIIYLASKGYLKIESEPASLAFTINKLKEYDGKNTIESQLMDSLFENNSTIHSSELTYSKSFYNSCANMIKQLDNNCKKLYEKESLSVVVGIIPVTSIIISFLLLAYSFFGDFSFIFSDTISILICAVAIIFGLNEIIKKAHVAGTILFIIFLAFPLTILAAVVGVDSFAAMITSLIALVTSLVCFCHMPKKNKAAMKLLGNIAGFKHFLEVAEKHRIELLAKENPSYCFDVLSYAYTLGVSDEFIKKFENIIKSNFWEGDVSLHSFRTFTNACYKTVAPSVENGGISKSSGGGHSGGGCGGGGGHSW